ncbi:MAG: type II toxin-antitoxin system PemK/MazF family toxin [Clostridia bacterium]|nr:type II toxin-antitoxin system PemK/MazF family toxin [Clostridia bacterium]
MEVVRGDIFIADLDPVVGSEQGGIRPVLIVQNDRGNRFSPTVICAAMTSRLGKNDLPTHVWIAAKESGLQRDSLVLCEQIRTLEKRRLRARAGHVEGLSLARVNRALAAALGIAEHGLSAKHEAGR